MKSSNLHKELFSDGDLSDPEANNNSEVPENGTRSTNNTSKSSKLKLKRKQVISDDEEVELIEIADRDSNKAKICLEVTVESPEFKAQQDEAYVPESETEELSPPQPAKPKENKSVRSTTKKSKYKGGDDDAEFSDDESWHEESDDDDVWGKKTKSQKKKSTKSSSKTTKSKVQAKPKKLSREESSKVTNSRSSKTPTPPKCSETNKLAIPLSPKKSSVIDSPASAQLKPASGLMEQTPVSAKSGLSVSRTSSPPIRVGLARPRKSLHSYLKH